MNKLDQGVAVRRAVRLGKAEYPAGPLRVVPPALANIPIPMTQSRHLLGLRELCLTPFQGTVRLAGAEDVANSVAQECPINGLGLKIRCPNLIGTIYRFNVIVSGDHQDGRVLPVR